LAQSQWRYNSWWYQTLPTMVPFLRCWFWENSNPKKMGKILVFCTECDQISSPHPYP